MKRRIIVSIIVLMFVLSLASSASDQWSTFFSKDEMTGEENWYATSLTIGPTEKMNFPYGDVTAYLGVGYDGEDEWIYIGFTEAPNLNGTIIKDGYNLIKTRIKWDDELENISMTQNWGSKIIHFQNNKIVVSKIVESNTMLLELDWYGEDKVYFRFSLAGSSTAIDKIHDAFEG